MDQQRYLDLDDALTIQGPHRLNFAPNAYSFTRKRELTSAIDFWDTVFKDIGISDGDLASRKRSAIRRVFEAAWGLREGEQITPEIIARNASELTKDWPAYSHDPDSVYTTKFNELVDAKFFLFKAAASAYRTVPTALKHVSIEQGCAIRLPLRSMGERWFQVWVETDLGSVRPALSAELSAENWTKIWDSVAELVFVNFALPPTDAEVNQGRTRKLITEELVQAAKSSFASVEIVRADAPLIEQQYRYLKSEKRLALELSKRAETILATTLPNATPASIPALTFQYRELNSYLPRVEVLRRQLADAASDIGYKLFLETTTVSYTDETGKESPVEIPEGELYKEAQKTVNWITYQTVTRTQRSLFRKRTVQYQIPVENRKTFTFYEKARVDYDPWTEVAEVYRRSGYNVHLFREVPEGLVAADGTSIASVMARCARDEKFRRTCVVGVPFYEYTIIGERMLVGYTLLVRPLPEIAPSDFPSISVDERLTYRFAWKGVALGELAATIPLAPGEERTVTIAVAQKYESTRSVTTSSLNEITRVDKSDFETVFEKEVRKEKESNATSGGSIGGSYGGFSGSANFSKSTTTKDMSRQLNRSVQRASQELTRRAKEESTVSVSERTETSTSSTTSYKLRNINEGRTLNITLHRLLNDYESNLYLDDFDLAIEAGAEIVMGTGLRESRTFSRSDLAPFWEHLVKPGVLPVDVNDKRGAFQAALCRRLLAEMTKEYGSASEHAMEELSKEGASILPAAITERLIARKLEGEEAISDADLSNLVLRAFSTESCKFDGWLNKPFEATFFSYDSGGLHADAQVGLRPATEEYSERMRALEMSGKAAEQQLVYAKANYLNSRGLKNLLAIDGVIDKQRVYVTDRMALYESDGHVVLKLRLSVDVLPTSGWGVEIKGGGRYLQSDTRSDGVLEFSLPRFYADAPWDIGNKPHQWFVTTVSVNHQALKINLPYRAPA